MSDPVQFINQIFNGIVQFIFNVIYSVATLLRNPVRGTLRLVARYRYNKAPQISYVTLLFLLNCASYLFYETAGDYPISGSGSYPGLYAEVSKHIVEALRGVGVTKTLIYATGATAVQQLWIISETTARWNASPPTIATLKLGFLFLYCYLLWFLTQLTATMIIYFGDYNFAQYLGGALLVFGFATLCYIIYRTRVLVPISVQKRIVVALPLVLVATQVGSYLFTRAFAAVTVSPLRILTLSCATSDKSHLDVEATIANLTDDLLIVNRGRIRILGKATNNEVPIKATNSIHRRKDGELELSPDNSLAEYTILEPKRATQIKFRTQRWNGPADDWDSSFRCGLKLEAVTTNVADEYDQLPLPQEYKAQGYEKF